MKRTEEGRVYVVKTIKMSSEMEAKEIREKKMNCGKILKKRHTIP